MPSGDYANKERQSVYKKALVVCHEDEKQLTLMQHKLDQNKLQKYIDYKLEEKRLQKELLQLRQEQMTLMQEARQRQKEHKTVDDLAKEVTSKHGTRNRNLETLKLKKKFSFPYITPTQRNIPKIMKRSLSYESEYFTWTFGLPNIEGPEGKLSGNLGKHHGKRADKLSNSLNVTKQNSCDHFSMDGEPKNCKGDSEDKEKTIVKEKEEIKLPCIETPNRCTPKKEAKKKVKKQSKSVSDSKLPPIV